MAGSSSNRKFYDHHSRSNSLPSSSHPLITQLDDHLCRLKASQATSASVSSQSIGRKLNDLQDLYECVDKFLQLPLTQQVLAHAHKEKWVDELLDGSLSVLEACTTAKDSLLHTKESARELQSILRRRAGCFEICRNSELQKYLVSRKVVKKAIKKALKDIQNKCSSSTSHGEDETRVIMSLLKEVEAVTLEVFESLLSFISGPKAKATGWPLVSKLVYQKRVACTKEEINHGNEFSKVDSALLGLILDSTGNSDKLAHIIKNLQSQLDDLDSTFQDLENGLHCLFRQLIKSRVAFLNILNP